MGTEILWRAEPREWLAMAADQDLLTGRSLLHVVAEVIAELVGADIDRIRRRRSGASGARTRDLVHAMHALSQLSYGPREVILSSEV